ncbi:helix-turn-helix domain-containing protein [Arthrobacter sp. AOP36-A1-22]|uniref:helix-turn-helix domain-containing protein n=1 Tax=Arthrobacter sp. AOP36-A1-22 TaxID=3457684 RepID=UPI004034085D
MSAAIDPRMLHVGNRIRTHRQGAGLSLTGLATAAGIGKGTLSELEHGQRNPTLETLYAVAGVLGVPLAGFVSTDDGHQPVASQATGGAGPLPGDGAISVGGGPVSARLLEARRVADGSLIEVYWLTIGPGRRVSPAHGRGVAERLVLVGGEAEVGPEGWAKRIKAGQALSWESSGRHVYSSDVGAEGVLTIINPPIPGAAGR